MRSFVVILIVMFMASLTGTAQVPQKMSYQGLLTNTGGSPLPDGSYDLKFDLYNASAGGTLRFTQTLAAVPVERGTFSVVLSTLPAVFSESLFVEVAVLAGPGIGSPLIFSPRTELTSAPYSLAPWVTSGAKIYYNVTDAKVGIGTSTPTAPLNVAGSMGPSADGIVTIVNSGTDGNGIVVSAHGPECWAIWAQAFGGGFGGYFDGKGYFRDNVGIGTTTPDANAKLDVNGYAFSRAPLVVYDSAAGSGTSISIVWLNDVRVDNNLVEKQLNNVDFKLKKAGWYRVDCRVRLESVDDGPYGLWTRTNGEYDELLDIRLATSFVDALMMGSTVVQSNGNDVLSFEALSWYADYFLISSSAGRNKSRVSIEYLGAD